MPIYEYRCEQCGHELEKLQKSDEPPITACPACHKDTLKKLVSAAGFRLKGQGWYETDFKHSGKKKEQAGDKSSDKKTTEPTAKRAADGAGKAK